MKNFWISLFVTSFLTQPLFANTEEKLHKLSDIDKKCKQLSTKSFNCEKVVCKYTDTVDGIANHWTISVLGPQKKLCKVSVVLDNPDVTKTNVFLLTKLERNNLAAYYRQLFNKKESTIVREQACCSASNAAKNFCYVTVNGSRVLDVLDDRPYFGCDGTKLFEVEQHVVGKSGGGFPEAMPPGAPQPGAPQPGAPQPGAPSAPGAPDMGLPPGLQPPPPQGGVPAPNGGLPPPSSNLPPPSDLPPIPPQQPPPAGAPSPQGLPPPSP